MESLWGPLLAAAAAIIIIAALMARSASRRLPYEVKDGLMSECELAFHEALRRYVGDRAAICPKVGIKDFVDVGKRAGKDYMKYFGKISRKHVDFLICENDSYRPLCAIELNDSSHLMQDRMERDVFVNKLFEDAGFPLITFTAKQRYSSGEFEEGLGFLFAGGRPERPGTRRMAKKSQVAGARADDEVFCPKCGSLMTRRIARKGTNAGREFYGCTSYPDCKCAVDVEQAK